MTYDEVIQSMKDCHLPRWDELPDFGLYMDQMVTCVSRVFPGISGRLDVTPNMINNYVKAGLIARPVGKKYSRDALAQLLMITVMKISTPLDVMKKILHPSPEENMEQMYTAFVREHHRILDEITARGSIPALDYALESASQQLTLRMLLS